MNERLKNWRLEQGRNSKLGYTLTELVVVLAIIGIIISMSVVAIFAFYKNAYMTRADDTAKVVYMALQSELTALKNSGDFESTFEGGDGTYYAQVPDEVIEGFTVGDYTYEGALDAEGEPLSDEEKEELIASGDLVYMVISQDENSTLSSDLFIELIDSYLTDKTIMDQTLVAEINLSNQTVRCVFYTERVDEMSYYDGVLDDTNESTATSALESEEDLYLRNSSELKEKWQGYYGTLSIGADIYNGELDSTEINVYNDDMLVIEWAEAAPIGTEELTDEIREEFTNMTYDISIVNAYDTTQVYYKITGITAYEDTDTYAADLITENQFDGLSLPYYDLFTVSGLETFYETAKTSYETEVYSNVTDEAGNTTRELVSIAEMDHSISYYVPSDVGTEQQLGVYRLVLDYMGEDGSVADNYSEIPWDENFKVIVEVNYEGVGYDSTITMSTGVDNAYVEEKQISPTEDFYVYGIRGASVLEELVNYVKNTDAYEVKATTNMWYAVSYSRHLQNMQYIIGNEETTIVVDENGKESEVVVSTLASDGTEKNAQNFLLTADIDWSVQKIGAVETSTGTEHMLVVANSSDILTTTESSLRTFEPLVATGSDGYQGTFMTEIAKDDTGALIYETDETGTEITQAVVDSAGTTSNESIPVYEDYEIQNLRIDTTDDTTIEGTGLFTVVGNEGELKNLTLSGLSVYGTTNVGGFAGIFAGVGQNLTITSNTTTMYYTEGSLYNESIWSESTFSNDNKTLTSIASDNVVSGSTNVGGMFGQLISDDAENASGGLSGVLMNATNGTRFTSRYLGVIADDEDQTQDTTEELADGVTVATASADIYNGIAVTGTGTGATAVGGLIGSIGEDAVVTSVVNTGSVTSAGYASTGTGGIAGTMAASATIVGIDTETLGTTYSDNEIIALYYEGIEDEAVDASALYVSRTFEYTYTSGDTVKEGEKEYSATNTNYGEITGYLYVGGIVGKVVGGTTEEDVTTIEFVSNAGPVYSSGNNAGGIVGLAGTSSAAAEYINISYVYNEAEVKATFATNSIENGYRSTLISNSTPNEGGITYTAAIGNAGGIVGSGAGNLVILGASNYETASGTAALTSYVSSYITDGTTPQIYAYSNAGGIAGILTGYAEIQDLYMDSEDEDVDVDVAVATTNSMFIDAYQYNAGGIVGFLGGNASVNTTEEIITETYTSDTEEIITETVTSETEETYSNNTGDIVAKYNAGGVIGTSTTTMPLYNLFNSGDINASGGVAGGIIGYLSGSSYDSTETEEDDEFDELTVSSFSNTEAIVYLIIKEELANNTGSVGGVTTLGGIVGTANGGVIIRDVYNSGTVGFTSTSTGFSIATSIVGGLVGQMTGSEPAADSTTVNYPTLTATVSVVKEQLVKEQLVLEDPYWNNSAAISLSTATNVGGTVGYVQYGEITEIYNDVSVYGKGSVGGIIGKMDGGILSYDETYETAITEGVYTNSGDISIITSTTSGLSYEYAGGIVGYTTDVSPISITDVYNSGAVSGYKYVGGIIGNMTGGTLDNSASASFSIPKKMYTNAGTISSNAGYAGGIIGSASATAGTNAFVVKDVYNTGDLVAAGFSTTSVYYMGGIFGYTDAQGYGSYINTEEHVNELLKQGMRTNSGDVNTVHNVISYVGGIFGRITSTFANDITDIYNDGVIYGGSYVGGIVGNAEGLDLSYSETVLSGFANATPDANKTTWTKIVSYFTGEEEEAMVDFVFTNENTVTGTGSYVGGIAGSAKNSSFTDVFNSGIPADEEGTSYEKYLSGEYASVFQVTGGYTYTGGFVGQTLNCRIDYSDLIQSEILANANYVYSNIANVYGGSHVGGIVGYSFSGGYYLQLVDVYNAGTISGWSQYVGGIIGFYSGSTNFVNSDIATYRDLEAEDSENVTSYGIVSDEDYTHVNSSGTSIVASYITTQTIVAGRYTNTGDVTGGYNVGGIAGAAMYGYIENAFNSGDVLSYKSSSGCAGGIVGYMYYSSIVTYNLYMNGAEFDETAYAYEDEFDETAYEAYEDEYYSTFSVTFEKEETSENPYAVYVGNTLTAIDMTPNTGTIEVDWSSATTEPVFTTGLSTSYGRYAGGIAGYVFDSADIERAYAVGGEIIADSYVGGIAGYMYESGSISQCTTSSSLDLLLPTTYKVTEEGEVTLVERGSAYVGGIVGYTYSYWSTGVDIYDVRNFADVEGRMYVGGIIGADGSSALASTSIDYTTSVTLAQNLGAVIGTAVTAETIEEAYPNADITSESAIATYDSSLMDGRYIGGILGGTINSEASVEITMAKTDTSTSSDFSELASNESGEYLSGGSTVENPYDAKEQISMVSGVSYVGGISGYGGVVNYSVNAGEVSGITHLGGISGVGYRITNSYNTGNVNGSNGYVYQDLNNNEILDSNEYNLINSVHIGGIAGQIGIVNYASSNTDSQALGTLQIVDEYSYIMNCYNTSEYVIGQSYVGGIAGYALSSINGTYNTAIVSTRQDESVAGAGSVTGNKVGGIIGVMAQSSTSTSGVSDISLSNSYNVGQIVGTSDMGGLVGIVEGYLDEIVSGYKILNSYYLSDNEVLYYNASTGQMGTDINYSIDAIFVTEGYTEGAALFVDTTSNFKILDADGLTSLVLESELGRRTYSTLVASETETETDGYTGVTNTLTPLNAELTQSTTAAESIESVSATFSDADTANSATYYYEAASTDESIDFQFIDLSFTGATDTSLVRLDDYISGYTTNQVFDFANNVEVSTVFEGFSTDSINYMEDVIVSYNANDSNDTSEYTGTTLVDDNENADNVYITYRDSDAYPTGRNSEETISFSGYLDLPVNSASDDVDEYPMFIYFDVYDGFSRAEYNYDNTLFTVSDIQDAPLKTYTFVREDLYSSVFGTEVVVDLEWIEIEGIKYYAYASDASLDASSEYNSINNIKVSVYDSSIDGFMAGSSDQTITLTLDTEEMQSYLAADSGFFTVEGRVLYDTDENGNSYDSNDDGENDFGDYDVSRMFSMHFSNAEIDASHNDSVFDVLEANGGYDIDELATLDNGERSTDGTAALGSELLVETSASNVFTKIVAAFKEFITGVSAETTYKVSVNNRLQITNERHLYNLNTGDTVGYAGTGSTELKYLNNDYDLMNDIQLSVNDDVTSSSYGYNGFIIGASYEEMYRFTGSLDGNDHTIGNLTVDRIANPGVYVNDTNYEGNIADTDYALFYDISGGVVKELYIGSDSTIVGNNVAALSYYVSNGRTASDSMGEYYSPYTDTENLLFENIGAALPDETGADAKIIDVEVGAELIGDQVGGIVFETARRFQNTDELSTAEDTVQSATFLDCVFSGVINQEETNIESNYIEYNGIEGYDYVVELIEESKVSAGIIAKVSGTARTEDIIHTGIGVEDAYSTSVVIDNCSTTDDAFIYAKHIASGILGYANAWVTVQEDAETNPETGDPKFAEEIYQNATITNCVNNATIYAQRYANGISQGIMVGIYDSYYGTIGEVDISYCYNNGLVEAYGSSSTGQSYSETFEAGLSEDDDYTIAKGSIASGIGNKVSSITYSKNTGTVKGEYASGITSHSSNTTVIDSVVNTGTIIASQIAGGITAAQVGYEPLVDGSYGATVLTYARIQISNAYNAGTVLVSSTYDESEKASVNSYAGGILGFASADHQSYYSWNEDDVNDIASTSLVSVTNSYNVGFVGSTSGTSSEVNHGGIVGGGQNFYVDITNSYSLSDPELEWIEIEYEKMGTDNTVTTDTFEAASDAVVNVVGNAVYSTNVTTLRYDQMIDINSYVGFDFIDTWTIGGTEENGNYLFPRFQEWEIGQISLEEIGYKFADSAETYPTVSSTESTIGYNYATSTDGTVTSEYTITIDEYTTGYAKGYDYSILIYDGDANATDYEPMLIARYDDLESLGDDDGATFESGTLTISDEEELEWNMAINGYYTALVIYEGTGTMDESSDTSDRFNVHFGGTGTGGSTIEARSTSAYSFGTTADKSFYVTDQYSILGMETAGIAKYATVDTYFKQVGTITITEAFDSIFEFNGVYDGDGYSIIYDNDDIGFVFYQRTVNTTALEENVTSTVTSEIKNLNIVVDKDNDNFVGDYPEAANYVANAGLVSTYVEGAKITNVSTSGSVVIPSYFETLLYSVDFAAATYDSEGNLFAGIAAVVKSGSVLTDVSNAADISSNFDTATVEIPFGDTIINYEYVMAEGLSEYAVATTNIYGIAGLVKDSKIDTALNTGDLTSPAGETGVSGIAYELTEGSTLKNAVNTGNLQTDSGIATGIVTYLTSGTVTNVYNTGNVEGMTFKEEAVETEDATDAATDVEKQVVAGTSEASGLFGEVASSVVVNDAYNAGYVNAATTAGIALEASDASSLVGEAYYLYDEDMYWTDLTDLPGYAIGDLKVTSDEFNDLLLYLGFGTSPVEVPAIAPKIIYTDGVETTVTYDSTQYAVSAEDLSSETAMSDLGFDTNVWSVDEKASTYVDGGAYDYGTNIYPFIQLGTDSTDTLYHYLRSSMEFPIYYGEANEVAVDSDAKYVAIGDLDVAEAGNTVSVDGTDTAVNNVLGQSEVFQDTISITIDDLTSLDKYEILIYEGEPTLIDGTSDLDKDKAVYTIVIERKYFDLSSLGSSLVDDILDYDSKSYTFAATYINSIEDLYYYEIASITLDDGTTVQPALFVSKEAEDDGSIEIVLNNNLLDELSSTTDESSSTTDAYYTATVIEYQVPGEATTNTSDYYTAFNPHFEDEVESQGTTWTYGTESNPHVITEERHFANISASSLYLDDYFVQKADLTLTDAGKEKPESDTLAAYEGWTTVNEVEEAFADIWDGATIGSETVPFQGSYVAVASEISYSIVDERTTSRSVLFGYLGDKGTIEDVAYVLSTAYVFGTDQSKLDIVTVTESESALFIESSAGTVADITVSGTTISADDTENTVSGVVELNISEVSTFGTVIGQVTGGTISDITVEDTLSLETLGNNLTDSTIGTVIGEVVSTDAKTAVTIKNVTSAVDVIAEYGIPSSLDELGGIIGSIDTVTLDLVDVSYSGDIELQQLNSATAVNVGGIAGTVSTSTVVAVGAENSGDIDTTVTDFVTLNVGGIFGSVEDSTVSITSSVNEGYITADIGNSSTSTTDYDYTTAKLAGAIGSATGTITIDGFENRGNILVTGGDYTSDVYLAGALAYAGKLKSATETSVEISQTLNEGSIIDYRYYEDDLEFSATEDYGVSIAAGIVAQVVNSTSVTIENNHNLGAIKAREASGIVHYISEDGTIGTGESASVKWNVNQGNIEGAYVLAPSGDDYTEADEVVATPTATPTATSTSESDDTESTGGTEGTDVVTGGTGTGTEDTDTDGTGTVTDGTVTDGTVTDGTVTDTDDTDADDAATPLRVETAFNITATEGLPIGLSAAGVEVTETTEGAEVATYYNLGAEDMVRPNTINGGVATEAALTSSVWIADDVYEEIKTVSGWTEDQILEEAKITAGTYTSEVIGKASWKVTTTNNIQLLNAAYTSAVSAVVTDDGVIQVSWSYIPEDTEDKIADDEFVIALTTSDNQVMQIFINLSQDTTNFVSDSTLYSYSYPITAAMWESITGASSRETLYQIKVGTYELTEDTTDDATEKEFVELEDMDATVRLELAYSAVSAVSNEEDSIICDVTEYSTISRTAALMSAYNTYNTSYTSTVYSIATTSVSLTSASTTSTTINGYDTTTTGFIVSAYAYSRIGDPYSQDLAGTGAYLDCSYLAMLAYAEAGITIPRTAAAQYEYCVKYGYTISGDDLQPGDLIFYSYTENGRYEDVSHVAIYIGEGLMVHAANSTVGTVCVDVIYSNIDGYGRITE